MKCHPQLNPFSSFCLLCLVSVVQEMVYPITPVLLVLSLHITAFCFLLVIVSGSCYWNGILVAVNNHLCLFYIYFGCIQFGLNYKTRANHIKFIICSGLICKKVWFELINSGKIVFSLSYGLSNFKLNKIVIRNFLKYVYINIFDKIF